MVFRIAAEEKRRRDQEKFRGKRERMGLTSRSCDNRKNQMEDFYFSGEKIRKLSSADKGGRKKKGRNIQRRRDFIYTGDKGVNYGSEITSNLRVLHPDESLVRVHHIPR